MAEAQMAITAGAWAIGLVADMPSGPGPIPDEDIRAIARATRGRIKRFLLTSRTKPQDVVRHVSACGTGVVQLVDAVPDETYAALRIACPDVRIVQVIHVQGEVAIARAHAVAPHCDMILLDSGNPDAPLKSLGGTGRTHNWEISARIVKAIGKPVILAGGLTPENAHRANDLVKPYALDVCSGLRREGFRLDAQKLNTFARAVR